MYPQTRYILTNELCTGVSLEYSPLKTWTFMSATFLSFACAVPIALYLILKSFSMLNDFTSKMSPTTRRLHRQLLYSLMCQFSIPFVTLIAPFMMLCILGSIQIHSKSSKYLLFFAHQCIYECYLLTVFRLRAILSHTWDFSFSW